MEHKTQEEKVNEIYTAIVGNNMGQKGIVNRLEDLKKIRLKS